MIQDIVGLPLAGGALFGGAAYAALSLFVTGPLVAERTIENFGWPAICARQVRAETAPSPGLALPALDCESLLGTVYGAEGTNFCARYGGSLAVPLDLLGVLAGQPLEATRRRAEEKARRAGSACGCAVAFVIEDRRIDFAIYAGTARLVTPPPVRGLAGELDRALTSPACRIGE